MKLTHKSGAKIAAWIVCAVSGLALMLSAIAVVVFYDNEFYTLNLEDTSLDEKFLDFVGYGYLDVSYVCYDLAEHIDSWQLFGEKDNMSSVISEYVDENYPADDSRYGIRIYKNDGSVLYSNVDDGSELLDMYSQEYRLVCANSIEQYLNNYGGEYYYYDEYYTSYEVSYDGEADDGEADDGEADAADQTAKAEDQATEAAETAQAADEDSYTAEISDDDQSLLTLLYGRYSFEVYKGQFVYSMSKSDYLQKFYMDMADALSLFGSEKMWSMVLAGQAYVYTYDMGEDMTSVIGDENVFETVQGSSRFVINNLYSDLTEDERLMSIVVYLDLSKVMADYGNSYRVYSIMYNWRYGLIAAAGIFLILTVSSFIFLMFSSGHNGASDEIQLTVTDKIPADLYFGIILAADVFVWLIVEDLSGGIITVAAALYVTYLAAVVIALSVGARLKAGTLISNILTGRFVRFVFDRIMLVVNAIPSEWLGMGAAVLTAVVLMLMSTDPFMVVVIIIALWLALLSLAGYGRLWKAAGSMASGNLEYKLDEKKMPFYLRKHVRSMNAIGSSMQTAVDRQMKSERMKTELITNVSHDIKTPLTSIINYIDLLKKEDIQSPHAAAYLEVLDKQSIRLKKLIVDLIEASKASSGSIEVNLVRTDVNELIVQTTAEYEEKAAANGLELVVNLLTETGFIYADSRHICRVIDNLLSNACKYSLADTRIYIDIIRTGGQIAISFKNISAMKLNIPADELMERFVRADSSRNTEGSGLGLSIAQSLTQLQGGKMSLDIDGDLFKCVLIFPEIGA